MSFVDRKVPLRVLEVTLASLTDSTVKQYTKSLRDWWQFCHSSAVPLFAPSPTQFLECLAQQLEQIGSYSSINSIRSVVLFISEQKQESSFDETIL